MAKYKNHSHAALAPPAARKYGLNTPRKVTIGLLVFGLLPMLTTAFGCAARANPQLPHADHSTTHYYHTVPHDGSTYQYNYTVPANTGTAPSPEILRGEPEHAAQTFTGLRALPEQPITIAQPNSPLPTKKIEHSYGVAKNGQPHQISLDNQNFFDAHPEYAAIAYDTRAMEPGGEKTLYLTFDCGYENGNTAIVLDVLKEKNVPAAFFCTVDELKSAPEIVARMINEGHIVGNHSVTHPSFSGISRTKMAEEVIGADNYLRTHFGYSAPFFRYPKGDYNESALEAVASMGFSNIFWSSSYADWDTNAQKGPQYALDTVMSRLHPGAIILLHSVSSDNAQAMSSIIDQAREQGYVFRELTDLPLFHS